MRWYTSTILLFSIFIFGCGADEPDSMLQEASYVDTAEVDSLINSGADIRDDTLTFTVLEEDRVAQLTEEELELLSQYLDEAQSLPDRMATIKGREITVGEAIVEQRKRQQLMTPLIEE